jgi:hypothetical protein
MRLFLAVGLGLVLSVGIVACAQDAPEPTVSRHVERQVLDLEPGESIGQIEARLGNPRLKKSVEGDTVLYYGLWQLVFDSNQELENWTRYLKGERWNNIRALNTAVSSLKVGESMQEVRSELGVPMAIQVLAVKPARKEKLWYGNGRWALEFVDKVLERRTHS